MIHLSAFFAIYVKFFFIMTPFFVTTIFLSMTKGVEESDKKRLAIKVTLAISITCLVILFFGKYIFELFGITLDAFRIGAGALLFLTAVDLVQKEINAEPTCKTDEDGKLTNENISASSHKFNLIGPSSAIYSILNKYLGVDWDQLSKFVNIRSDIALAPTMQMQEEGTEYVVNGDVTLFPQIPENILK
jgi:hypothetical protein